MVVTTDIIVYTDYTQWSGVLPCMVKCIRFTLLYVLILFLLVIIL